MKRYIIADTHFNHNNIAIYCDRPSDFESRIIKNWKSTVHQQDIVYVLGDVILYHTEQLKEYLSELPGKKVMVRGNHDGGTDTFYLKSGFDFIADAIIVKDILLTHKPCQEVPSWIKWNIHGHLHNLSPKDERSFGEIYGITDKHILYSPEFENYFPVEISKLIARRL